MRPVLLAAWMLLLAACKASPNEKADKLHQTQQSWEKTARLTTELWRRGAVPAEYARRTLNAAREELDKASRDAEKLLQ